MKSGRGGERERERREELEIEGIENSRPILILFPALNWILIENYFSNTNNLIFYSPFYILYNHVILIY